LKDFSSTIDEAERVYDDWGHKPDKKRYPHSLSIIYIKGEEEGLGETIVKFLKSNNLEVNPDSQRYFLKLFKELPDDAYNVVLDYFISSPEKPESKPKQIQEPVEMSKIEFLGRTVERAKEIYEFIKGLLPRYHDPDAIEAYSLYAASYLEPGLIKIRGDVKKDFIFNKFYLERITGVTPHSVKKVEDLVYDKLQIDGVDQLLKILFEKQ